MCILPHCTIKTSTSSWLINSNNIPFRVFLEYSLHFCIMIKRHIFSIANQKTTTIEYTHASNENYPIRRKSWNRRSFLRLLEKCHRSGKTSRYSIRISSAGDWQSYQGWQISTFAVPITVTTGITYVASYRASVGQYSYTQQGLATSHTHNMLTAAQSGGVFSYTSAMPNQSFNNSNYWVDVVFKIAQ